MKAILVKYCGPTNTRGSRWKVSAEGVPSRFYSLENVKPDDGRYDAAVVFACRMGWMCEGVRLVGGGLPDGSTAYVFVE